MANLNQHAAMEDLQESLDSLKLEEENPMKAVVIHLTNRISTMTVDQQNIKKQNKLLKAADNKSQIETN